MSLIHKYANFDLTTGANDGSSEASAWQDYASMKAGVTPGQHVHIKRTAVPTSLPAADIWTLDAEETDPIIIQGYADTPEDGGYANFVTANNSFWRINGEGKRLINLELMGNYASHAAQFSGDGTLVADCRIINTVGGALSVTDCSIFNCYLEGHGNQGNATLYISRCVAKGNMIAHKGSTANAIAIASAYRVNYITDNLIVCSSAGNTANGVYVVGDTNNGRISIVGNTIDGFDNGFRVSSLDTVNGSSPVLLAQNLITNCSTGIQNDGAATTDGKLISLYNAFYNCSTAVNIGSVVQYEPIFLSTDPFEDRAAQDFTLNDATDGGAKLKGAVPFGAQETHPLSIGAL